MIYTIYCLVCLKNNRVYIGITHGELQIRFNQHLSYLKNNKHTNKLLQKDYNDFNLDKTNFIILPLEKVNCNTQLEMLDCENKWIKFYKDEYYRGIYNIQNIREGKEEIANEQKYSYLKRENEDYLQTWELIKEGMRNRDISKLLGVSTSFVSSIRNGRNWVCKYIDDFIPGIKPKKI